MPVPLISELGVYGVYARLGNRVLLNEAGGSLLRSKPASTDEGGIVRGTGALDFTDLVPMESFLKHISFTE